MWIERVARWRESGQSAKEFSASMGLNVWTLRKWSDRLRREASSDGPGSEKRAASQKPSRSKPPVGPLSFVEVVTQPVAGGHSAGHFEIVLPTGVIVRIPEQFDAQALDRVLAAARGS